MLTLVIIAAPLLPPLGLAGKVQARLGVSCRIACLSTETFLTAWGSAGTRRYRQAVAEIEARLNRCGALAPQ